MPPREAKAKRLLAKPNAGALAAVLLGMAVGGVLINPLRDVLVTEGPTEFVPADAVADLIDDEAIATASFEPLLVQWGTDRPFTGTGPPGILLRVRVEGDVIGWTLEGWANETSPPPLDTCASRSVHFSSYDWMWQGNGSGARSQGAFATLPTTVPQRATPNGDQCLARVASTGVWSVTVCIEGKPGGPRMHYEAEDGTLRLDAWDRCLAQPFRVPS